MSDLEVSPGSYLLGEKGVRRVSREVSGSVVENLISIPSIQQLYRSLIFDKGQSFSNGIPEGRSDQREWGEWKKGLRRWQKGSLNRQIEICLRTKVIPTAYTLNSTFIRFRRNEPHDWITFPTPTFLQEDSCFFLNRVSSKVFPTLGVLLYLSDFPILYHCC